MLERLDVHVEYVFSFQTTKTKAMICAGLHTILFADLLGGL